MAITGKFAADFNAFYDACAKAESSLRLVQKGADNVSQSVNKAADSGPLLFQNYNKGATEAALKTDALHKSFSQFDSLLASVGIHIGPEIKAIGELGTAASAAAGSLGTLATGGLVVGAAIGGWKIGRAIADFFGLDEIVSRSASSLLGWGDDAAAKAGANADVLALASQRAGKEITSLTEAMAINQKFVDDMKAKAKDAADAHDRWAKAMIELDAAGQGWRGTLDTIDGTVVESIKFYLDAGVAQDKLSTAFGLTAVQVKSVTSAVAADEAALKSLADADAKVTAAIQAHWNDVGSVVDRVLGKPQLKIANDWMDAIELLGGSVEKLSTQDMADLHQAMLAAIDVMFRTGTLTDELSSKYAELAFKSLPPVVEKVDDLTDAYNKFNEEQDATRAALAHTNDELAKVPELAAAAAGGMAGYAVVTNGVAHDLFGRPVAGSLSNPSGIVPARAGGGAVSAGRPYMVGEKGPELFVPGSSGSIMPNGGGGMNVSIHVNGSVLGTPDQLARAISDAVEMRLRNIGTRVIRA